MGRREGGRERKKMIGKKGGKNETKNDAEKKMAEVEGKDKRRKEDKSEANCIIN